MRDYEVLINALNAMSNKNSCYYCQGETLVCEAHGCILSNAANAIEELLDELTTIRKQLPRWISVEDELPEEEKPVFVTYIGYNTGSLHSDMIAYQDGEGDWRYYDGDNGSDICKVDITHWMPLPAPPKEVE